MTPEAAVRQLRLLAIEQVTGAVGSDRLIRAGLDALVAGVDSPSLSLLAALTRAEEPDARQLFAQVIDELALAPELSADPTTRRWQLVRWWAHLIVAGDLDPYLGGDLIWRQDWCEYPDALQAIVAATCRYEDLISSYLVGDTAREATATELAAQIIEEARKLLAVPGPTGD